MNKKELYTALARKTAFSKKEAEVFTGAFIDVITETLQKGDKIQIVGFGTFEVKERAARKARNPRTGEEIDVAASKAPVFKVGKVLKDSIR